VYARNRGGPQTTTLGYTIPAGQTYVATDLVAAYYEISFNHRIAFVKATDVDTVS
jgi:hypothetical protein